MRICIKLVRIRNTGCHHVQFSAVTINAVVYPLYSVEEPPLFWAASAPEVRGPGANYGSDQIGSAPAPGKKKAALAPYTKIGNFERIKS